MRARQLLFVAGLAAAAALAPAQSALAHGGGDATSNYRTRVQAVEPQVTGLTVRLFDVQGTIKLTYTGSGTMDVIGYEGEPYLRIDADGVQQNIHSPATYLNQDRFARIALPAAADAEAEPEWQQISSGQTVSFHDHRTHWMSTVPPLPVQNDPDQVTVIFERWEIPLTIDGSTAVISGDLAWVPPPSQFPWLAIGALVAACTGALLFLGTRQRANITIAIAAVGTVLFIVDTAGYLRAGKNTGMQRFWLIEWPVVALLATAAVFVVRKRTSQMPSPFIALGALVIGAIGGWDRIDVIKNSQIQSSNPDWFTRGSAVACLAIGAVLLIRFLADLLPLVIGTSPLRRQAMIGTDEQS